MQFSTKQVNPEKLRTDCAVVAVQNGKLAGAGAQALDQALGQALIGALGRGDLGKRVGATQLVSLDGNVQRVLMVSLGESAQASDRQFVDACTAAYKSLATTASRDATSWLHEVAVEGRELDWKIQRSVRVARDTTYRFDRMKSKPDPAPKGPARIALAVGSAAEGRAAVASAQALANGMDLAKDLGNLPGNVCTPTYLADEARRLGKAHGLKVQVLDEKRMAALKMNTLLSVAKGSAQPPRLIVLEYRGAGARQAPVVLVGKGITFDTGGISLKPGAGMDEMKFDMCGAASVLGTMRAIAEIGPKINVIGIVAAAENMPGGRASKPGDIVTSMSGQTVEILNTDAEGRLVLCDALTYAERFKPAAVVDIATLTGACVIALGHHHSGLFCREDDLAEDLIAAGRTAGDTCWRMPLDDEYQEQLKSPFADMANIGGRDAGAVTAACFLARFTKQYPWAHLDIAGTAWKSGAAKGSSARPVPLLTEFILARAGN